MKKEINIFFTALMFYTRVPVPRWVTYSDEILNKSTRYFPLIGFLVGAIAAGIFYLSMFVFQQSLSVLFSMIATVYITGAFHEDGFADFCDGFGGGTSKEKVLSIMKDSRLGTYGTLGLLFMLSGKFLLLNDLPVLLLIPALLVAHTFSRVFPVFFIYHSLYVRNADDAKAKPVGQKSSVITLVIAIFTGLSTLLLLPVNILVIILPANLLTAFLFVRYVKKRIGGYTGDVLGALQQLSEIVFYISLYAGIKILYE